MARAFDELGWWGQTARILRSVWLDQRDYWAELRPLLAERRHERQAKVGGTLLGLALLLIPTLTAALLGVQISWVGLLIVVAIAAIVLPLLLRHKPRSTVLRYAIFGPVLGVTGMLFVLAGSVLAAYERQIDAELLLGLATALGGGLISGLVLGAGNGMHMMLSDGTIKREQVATNLQIAVMGFIFGGVLIYLTRNADTQPLGLLALPAMQTGSAAGIVLAGRWAARHPHPQPLSTGRVERGD